MKRIWMLILCVSCVVEAYARQDSLVVEPIYKMQLADSSSFQITSGTSRGTIVLGLLGHEVTLSRSGEGGGRVKYLFGFNRVEAGFNMLSEPDYSRYNPDAQGFLSLDTWRSFHVSVNLMWMQVALNQSRTCFFGTGLSYTGDWYSFSDRLILDNVDGRIVLLPLQGDQRGGKLHIQSLNIPVQADVVLWRKLMLSCYASADFNIMTRSGYRNRETWIHLPGVRPVTMSLGAMLAYDGVGLYVRYGVVPLFRHEAELVTRPLSFGVTIGF